MSNFISMTQIACFIGIVISMMDTLYPSEKFQKQIKLLFSLIFILSVTAPLMKQKFFSDDPVMQVSVSEYDLLKASDNAESYFVRSVENNISTRLNSELKKNNIECLNIQTSINILDNNSISINEVNIILNDNSQFDEAKKIIINELDNENTAVNLIAYENNS